MQGQAEPLEPWVSFTHPYRVYTISNYGNMLQFPLSLLLRSIGGLLSVLRCDTVRQIPILHMGCCPQPQTFFDGALVPIIVKNTSMTYMFSIEKGGVDPCSYSYGGIQSMHCKGYRTGFANTQSSSHMFTISACSRAHMS